MLQEFDTIIEVVNKFNTEQKCIEHLETLRFNGKPYSPFSEGSKVYKCSGNKYKCKDTGKYFNVRTGTIFDNTKIPLQKWFLALYVFSSHKKGISSHQLGRDIDVTQKTAWFMLHRLREGFVHPNFTDTLNDIVEIDETFMGGESQNKHANKKKKNKAGNTVSDQTPVLGMLQRGGIVRAKVVQSRHKDILLPIIYQNIEQDTQVMTDDLPAYVELKEEYEHYTVNHSAKEYVNGMAHTNGIENFWSHLKRGVDGIYHWVSKEHLQAYVNEFSLRFNTRKHTTQSRFDLILSDIAGKKLTFKKLTGKNE